jgi:hypothetical protein
VSLRAAAVRKVSARCCSALRLMFNVEHGFAGAAGQQWPGFQYLGDRGPTERALPLTMTQSLHNRYDAEA